MTPVLKVGNRTITAEETIPLIIGYQLLPQLLRELIIDQAIAPIECTPEETASARQQVYQQHQLTSEPARQARLAHHGMSPEQLELCAIRKLKIEKFKQATWGPKLEAYFLSHKGQLDKVIYSLIRTQDMGIAQELYFRIQAGEQSFAELAHEYSQGSEAQTGGLLGPVELRTIHPTLARLLAVGHPGKFWPLIRIEDWFVLVRLEQFLPAQLDDSMRQRLLHELFTTWLQEQLQQLGSVRPLSSIPALALQ